MLKKEKMFEFEEKTKHNTIIKFNKVNGVKQGNAISYYENDFYCKFKYENGLCNGNAIQYSQDGKKLSEVQFENDVKQGDATEYYENDFYCKFKYENDVKQGDAIEYYKNGKIAKRFKLEDGVRQGDAIEYYENGEYIKFKFKNNEPQDNRIYFNKSNKITRICVNYFVLNDEETILFLNKVSYIHDLSSDYIIELIDAFHLHTDDLLNNYKINTDKIIELEKSNKQLRNDFLNSKLNNKKNIEKISKLEKSNKYLRNELLSKNNSLEQDKSKYKKNLDEQYKDENNQLKKDKNQFKKENNQLKDENLVFKEEIRKKKNLINDKDKIIIEYTTSKNNYDKLDKHKKKLESYIESLENQIKDFKNEIKDLKREIELLKEQNSDLNYKPKYEEMLEKERKSREKLKKLKTGLDFKTDIDIEVIIEYHKHLLKNIEHLSIQQFTNLNKLPEKSKKYRWTINSKPFNERHPKWEKYSHILNEFNTVLHNKNKIDKLITRLGWKLKNCNNHKVYTKLDYRFVSPSTPSEWATTYFNLEKIEKEIIENVINF